MDPYDMRMTVIKAAGWIAGNAGWDPRAQTCDEWTTTTPSTRAAALVRQLDLVAQQLAELDK